MNKCSRLLAQSDRDGYYQGLAHRLTQEKSRLERQVRQLKKEVNGLKKENTELKNKYSEQQTEIDDLKYAVQGLAAKNVRAKSNKTAANKTKTPSNHARSGRKKPDRIDGKEDADQLMCPECGNRLSNIVDKYTRVVEDIVPASTFNTEYTVYRRHCKCCNRTITPKIPTALPNARFGIRLAVLIVVFKTLGISYQKIARPPAMTYSISMSESAVNGIVTKTAAAFGPMYGKMIEDMKKERNIHGDETGWRIDGKNYWLWSFTGKWTTIYEIDRSRGREAPMRILDGYEGNVTSDSWSAWNYVGGTHQRCHVHYAREIRETFQYKNPGKEFAAFAKKLRRLLYDSQKAPAIRSRKKRLAAKKRFECRLKKLISGKYAEKNCLRFVKRLRREKDMLFTFIETGTECHNNTAERAIRPNVIIRKITNGHRSVEGANSHKILMSTRETCRQRNLNFADYLVENLQDVTSKL